MWVQYSTVHGSRISIWWREREREREGVVRVGRGSRVKTMIWIPPHGFSFLSREGKEKGKEKEKEKKFLDGWNLATVQNSGFGWLVEQRGTIADGKMIRSREGDRRFILCLSRDLWVGRKGGREGGGRGVWIRKISNTHNLTERTCDRQPINCSHPNKQPLRFLRCESQEPRVDSSFVGRWMENSQ